MEQTDPFPFSQFRDIDPHEAKQIINQCLEHQYLGDSKLPSKTVMYSYIETSGHIAFGIGVYYSIFAGLLFLYLVSRFIRKDRFTKYQKIVFSLIQVYLIMNAYTWLKF